MFRTLVVVGLTLLGLGLPPAMAAAPRMAARVERVEVEPYFAGLARVRVWMNLMMLEGRQIENVKPEELQLVIGGTRLKQIPGIQYFDQRDDLLDIVVVVELHSSFSAAIEELEEPLAKFIAKLPKGTTRVSLVTYGEEVNGRSSSAIRAGRRTSGSAWSPTTSHRRRRWPTRSAPRSRSSPRPSRRGRPARAASWSSSSATGTTTTSRRPRRATSSAS